MASISLSTADNHPIGAALVVLVSTYNDAGTLVDPDSAIAADDIEVRVNGVVVSPTLAITTPSTGVTRVSITGLTLSVGDSIEVYATATIGAVEYLGSVIASAIFAGNGIVGVAGSLSRLVRGADYKAVNARAVEFTFTKVDNIATPGSAVVRFIITKRDDATETMTSVGTLSLEADAVTHKASFDIADTDTSGLALGDYEYRVEVVDDSSNIVVPIFSDRQRLLRLIDN